MPSSIDRAVRRHIREKSTIDRVVRGFKKPKPPADEEPAVQSPNTSSGASVEEQVRKEWNPRKGGLPTFLK